MSLKIALPLESTRDEKRVALDPSVVERLIRDYKVSMVMQSMCGRGAGFYDDDYEGVPVVEHFNECVQEAVLTVKVNPPTVEEARHLPIGSVLLSTMTPYQHLDVVEVLLEREITTFAMDLMPRITRAQPMDVLSSQATVAGYKAALLAAELSPRLFPMLTTAAGTIRPSRVIVIGAGVAGLQAIATARRLGAQVEAYDIRSAAREQIESLGARMIDTGVDAEGPGGSARSLNKEEKQTQHDVLADRMSRAHAVICAAAIPGRRAPSIITEDMVEGMLPDTLIVDMAAESGGNCELTRAGESYFHGDTLIVGPLNLPSSGAVHASEMYSRNIFNMLKLMLDERGQLHLDWGDEILLACLLTHNGGVYHKSTADLMEIECSPPINEQTERSEESPDQNAGWIEEDLDGSDTKPVAQNDESREPVDPASLSSTGRSSPTADASTNAVKSAQGRSSSSDASKGTEGSSTKTGSTDEGAASPGGSNKVDTMADEEPRDDLMKIDGIGPALQNRLYAFQIRTYAQLAALDDDGIETLVRQLDDNRELDVASWVEQARQMRGQS